MRLLALLVAITWGAGPIAAQRATLTRAVDLERRGDFTGAARIYRDLLSTAPGDVSALLGLERSLAPLNRTAELAELVSRALASSPDAIALYSVAIRAWTAAGQQDSVRRAVAAWAEREPGSVAPYQEWGMAALQHRDRRAARVAYQAGRQALGLPDALAGEMAQLESLEGDFVRAVPEWVTAIRMEPGYKGSAVGLLSQVPVDRRSALLAELGKHDGLVTRRIAASLQVRWGHPVSGFRWLREVLPPDGTIVVEALQDFLEEVRVQRSDAREARLAQGMAMEHLAGVVEGNQAARLWLDAAQAYADGGDQTAARRMLTRLASDPLASPGVAAQAAATLVGVLIEEGRMEDADGKLRELDGTLRPDERDQLRFRLAAGWLRAGALDRVEQLIANDSTVEGLALRGRARLFRGDLAGASALLSAAGPYAIDRNSATDRTEILAMLQVIAVDSLPALGRAFLALDQGDTVQAVAAFEEVGGLLPGDGGGGEALLAAGRLRGAVGDDAGAVPVLTRAAATGSPAAAAAAELELATVFRRAKRPTDAIALLEHLILTYPSSAAVPPARRLLETLRGGIPGREMDAP